MPNFYIEYLVEEKLIKLSEKVFGKVIGCLKIERYGENMIKKIIVVVAFMLTGFSLTAMSASAEEITDLFYKRSDIFWCRRRKN